MTGSRPSRDDGIQQSPNVFLGGVDEYVTPRDIVKALSPFGRVVAVSAPPHNLARGFAHAQFVSSSAAAAVVKERRLSIAHVVARVSFARGRRDRDGRPAGVAVLRGGYAPDAATVEPEAVGTAVPSRAVRSVPSSAVPLIAVSARKGAFAAPPLKLARFDVDADILAAGRSAAASTFTLLHPRDHFVQELGAVPVGRQFQPAGLAVLPQSGSVLVAVTLLSDCISMTAFRERRMGALLEVPCDGKLVSLGH